ncbi:hypothetical protein FRC14_004122, partial [Serendipita sp. 396]
MTSKDSGSLATGSHPRAAGGFPNLPETAILDPGFDSTALISAPESHNETPVTTANELERESLPWYKRPSPAWVLVGTFFAAISIAATLAPRVEVYIKLVCQEIRPEYEAFDLVPRSGGVMDWPSNLGTVTIPRPSPKCQADPEVQ